jgi:primosomal protein N' (replication factor Y)
MEQVLDGLAGSPARIIVGTQMMAKGHDVPGLELVVIADTDAQINHPDFRAPEWLLQQLIQVAGRAGRHRQTRPEGTRPAQVLIQTRYPQHPLFQALLADQPDAYAERLLEDRRTTGLPPFGYMALLRLSDTKYDRLHAWSQGLYKALKAMLEMHKNAAERPAADPWSQTHLYPAAPDYPERQGPRIRWHLVIEAPTRGCRALLAQEAESYAQRYPGVDLQIEIDPLSQN